MTHTIQKKICMVGAYAVGKTSLVKRFVDSIFNERYHTTIGVKVDKKCLRLEDTELTLMIWDLAGEDDIEQVRVSHLRGASGYILVADGCRNSTLERAIALRQCINGIVGPVPYVVALNKADLREEWEAEPTLEHELSAGGSAVFLTSAKTGESVEDMFRDLAMKMLEAS